MSIYIYSKYLNGIFYNKITIKKQIVSNLYLFLKRLTSKNFFLLLKRIQNAANYRLFKELKEKKLKVI